MNVLSMGAPQSLDPQQQAVPPRSSKRKPFLNENLDASNSISKPNITNNGSTPKNEMKYIIEESQKDHDKQTSHISTSRRIRSNTVGWSSGSANNKNQFINTPHGASGHLTPSTSSATNSTSSGSNDLNVDKSNAYFKRLSTLPEKKPTYKQRNKVTLVSRKLLFSLSEMYSAIKRFNIIGNNDSAISEKMAVSLSLAKRQINNLVEVLENVERENDLDAPRSPDIVFKVFKKNIANFKEVIKHLLDNLVFFTDKVDVCFIRMLLLSVFGCFNELYNASVALDPEGSAITMKKPMISKVSSSPSLFSQPAKSLASKQLLIPKTSSKSQLAGARISVVDPKDAKLYASSQSAITTAQRVCKVVIETMNKQYANEIQGHQGAEELLHKCGKTQAYARKLDSALALLTRSAFDHSNSEEQYQSFITEQEQCKRIFLIDFDSFITTVIQILASFKDMMNDFPELRSLRADMSLLSRTSKELIAIFKPDATKNEIPMSSSTDSGNSVVTQPLPSSAASITFNVESPVMTKSMKGLP
ncbi:Sog2 protein [Saccharomycopsis crataegensis]|uniref:Sog2 protein n=1 Tax=Saccharomycopsis crataegensis TaxID=43959 RepID=A0AAV5QGG7_9ASCO|nr:Sog2 protein [Saccharomycopsis crataegensis]